MSATDPSKPAKKEEHIPLLERILEYVLFRYRWIVVIFFVLPVSVIYSAYFETRNWLVYKLQSAPKAHDRKVYGIQKQIRDWNEKGRKGKLCTARSGILTMSFRVPKYKKSMIGVRTDKLVDILSIDTEARTVRVEPMVTMGQLTRFLIPLGYTLPIVPELDDLTVGGMINGCGVESSGRKYGMFQHICKSFEIVTASGELIVANKDADNEHHTLFYCIPWSHGTVGFLVAATLRIIPCKPYVRLAYYPCFTQKDLISKLNEEATRNENEFVEGIQFDKDTGVVMCGYMADHPPKNARVNAIGRWYKPWFFKHVEGIVSSSRPAHYGEEAQQMTVEYIPLRDYYHRHSRSIFWELQDLIPFGNNPIFRVLCGWAVPPKISLLKLTTPKPVKNIYDRHHVIQDMLVPMTRLEDAINLFHDEIEVYPLWLCPFNLPSVPGLVRNRTGRNLLYVDIGVYGTCLKDSYDPVETTRRLEKFVRDAQGVQMLYADSYMTPAEFWEMFDSTLYDWIRVKYDCKEAFPSVYEKVCRSARY